MWSVSGRSLCRDCVDRLAGTPLYSGLAVLLISLLHPIAASILIAINKHRLGDQRARSLWLAAALAMLVGWIALGLTSLPEAIFLLAGPVLGAVVTTPWRREFELLESAGFRRANAWWALLLTLVVLACSFVVLALIALASVQTEQP